MPEELYVEDVLADGPFCSIQRTLDVVGDRWTFLILREALNEGETQFTGFTKMLGIAPNILTDRLKKLVEAGILEKREYQVPGSRPRFSYHPTEAGQQLRLVLAALAQWGDDNNPHPRGPSQRRETTGDHRAVRIGYIDDRNRPRDPGDVTWVNTETYPYALREKLRSS